MAVQPRSNGGTALRLACWKADGVRSRKLELEEFLSEHGVDIIFLNETRL
jgi:exonuclease III